MAIDPSSPRAGREYHGQWALDKRHGAGTLELKHPDGRYEGEWEEDVRSGAGTVWLGTGEVIRGRWSKGQLLNPVDFSFNADSQWNDASI